MIGDIEAAIIARLEAASESGTLGYRLCEVTSYGGQLDEEINVVVKRFPAIWVTYSGDRQDPERVGTDDWKIYPAFSVIVAAQNYRNEGATRRGDGTVPGSYQMLQDARRLLSGHSLGLEIEPLAPGQAQSLFGGQVQRQRMSVFALPFHTSYEQLLENTDDLADFATFHADWDVPAFGGFDAVPLAAGEADATDDANLETA